MNQTPTVSILILNYNGLRWLKDCIESLSALDYPAERAQIILADNASTDGSVDFVQKTFPHVKILAFDKNLGFAAGNNRAVEQVDSEYILTINNDTISSPDLLGPMMDACQSGAACAAAHNLSWDGQKTVYCGGRINFFGTGLNVEAPPDSDVPFETRFACGCGTLMPRELFLEVGGYDEDFYMYQEDVDLGWRLNVLGHKIVAVPKATIRHYEGGTTHQTPTLFQKSVSIRNPMLAMVKNYEQDTLQKALPSLLLLTMNRVMVHMGVEGYDEQSLQVFEQKLAADNETDRAELVMTMANLAGLHGFLSLLSKMMPKRQRIQSRRTVSDAEIFEKFHVDLDYGSYRVETNRGVTLLQLLEHFNIANLLEPSALDAEVLQYVGLLDMRIAKLSSALQRSQLELKALQNSRSWRWLSKLHSLTRRLGFR